MAKHVSWPFKGLQEAPITIITSKTARRPIECNNLYLNTLSTMFRILAPQTKTIQKQNWINHS